MKKELFLVVTLLGITFCNAQYNFGASLAYSTENVIGFDLFLVKEKNRFHIGYGYQFSNQMNEIVKSRESNYGQSKIEDEDYLWMIDLGYSRLITNKLTVNPELSLGKLTDFTNYRDERFNDGGYSLINSKETLVGFGLNIGYFISDGLEPFLGFNSLKKLNFGIRYSL